MKSLKTWKTIIQFIITVLTAIVSSFAVQGCFNGNENETRGYETLRYENENFSTSQHSARLCRFYKGASRLKEPLNLSTLNKYAKH